ncbi:MAG TPA: signal peptide peptidase SppA [Bacteroidota bacterium]
MSTTTKWVIGLVVAFFIIFGILTLTIFAWMFSEPEDETVSSGSEKIALVELNEPIISSSDIVRQLKKYREDRSVKAIVFRVESPGGGVAASQEIYEEVKKTRDSGKPIVVSMGAVAASGGYYVSCAATRIVANPGTLTGSIGVIFQFLHFSELMKKLGIDESTFKSGKLKDSGSPFRQVTPEEKLYFQGLIADVYDQFVEVVAKERKLSVNYVKKYADGRVFTGRQAKQYGFVDTLGTMEDAVAIAAKLGGIAGKPRLIKEYRHRSFVDRMLGDAVTNIAKLQDQFLHQPIIQYRFTSPS